MPESLGRFSGIAELIRRNRERHHSDSWATYRGAHIGITHDLAGYSFHWRDQHGRSTSVGPYSEQEIGLQAVRARIDEQLAPPTFTRVQCQSCGAMDDVECVAGPCARCGAINE